jgi:hypothetical protein
MKKGVVNLICANKASTLLNKEDALKPKVQLLAQPNKKLKKYVCSVIQGHQKKKGAVITAKLTYLASQNMQ